MDFNYYNINAEYHKSEYWQENDIWKVLRKARDEGKYEGHIIITRPNAEVKLRVLKEYFVKKGFSIKEIFDADYAVLPSYCIVSWRRATKGEAFQYREYANAINAFKGAYEDAIIEAARAGKDEITFKFEKNDSTLSYLYKYFVSKGFQVEEYEIPECDKYIYKLFITWKDR